MSLQEIQLSTRDAIMHKCHYKKYNYSHVSPQVLYNSTKITMAAITRSTTKIANNYHYKPHNHYHERHFSKLQILFRTSQQQTSLLTYHYNYKHTY